MEQNKRDLPSSEQISAELRRVKYEKEYFRMFTSTISSLIVVAAVAVLISLLALPVLRVTGTSMMPTMQNDELIICSKRSNFETGDIVAFYLNNKILLKRVIGTAGDWVDVTEDGTVYVNNEPIDEPYLMEKDFGICDINLPYQVPDNCIFVMGDNRAVSVDSRSSSVGSISDEFVIGKVILRLFPFERLGLVG
ncbi:MAG: signal peptidase I [Oscillospiraceae bacterium]|nr:signal peptidase I [Oscillospiraceae bacterium]